MLQSRIGRHFLICFLILNTLSAGLFSFALFERPGILAAWLPGRFGPSLSADLTGNMLVFASMALLNGLLLLIFGIGGTWHALWAGLRVSPRKIRWLLHERAGLANDIAGVVAAAVQDEEKAEIGYLDRARGLLATGLVIFLIALPAVCGTYVHAAPDGPAIFESAGKPLPNNTVTDEIIVRFAVDQLAGALLLDIPEIFHLRATPVETNGANLVLGLLVLFYRTLMGFGLLLLVVGQRRSRALIFNALEVALPASEIIARDPGLQDGHGRHEERETDYADPHLVPAHAAPAHAAPRHDAPVHEPPVEHAPAHRHAQSLPHDHPHHAEEPLPPHRDMPDEHHASLHAEPVTHHAVHPPAEHAHHVHVVEEPPLPEQSEAPVADAVLEESTETGEDETRAAEEEPHARHEIAAE